MSDKPVDDLTDADVVREIAAYMGWQCLTYSYVERWEGEPPMSYEGEVIYNLNIRWAVVPDYLESYDALAPVWRKLEADGEKGGVDMSIRAARILAQIKTEDKFGEFTPTFSFWYSSEPRDHAYAIARALRANKEAPK